MEVQGKQIQEEQIMVEGLGIWEHFTVRDGLPDMKIECIFEDSKGVLWIGTHDRGVVCYEGGEFKTYTRRDGLVGDNVFSVIEDGDGYLWIGTKQGLSRYDGQKFETMFSEKGCSFLWGSCVDHAGNLWFGLERRPGSPAAVGWWDGERVELLTITDEVVSHGESVHDIAVDRDGKLWFGGDKLSCFDGVKFRTMSDIIGQIRYMYIDQDNIIWLTSEYGIFIYNQISFEQIDKEFSTNRVFHSILKDLVGNIWLTTCEGELICYNGVDFKIVNHLGAQFSLGFCLDSLGRLWIGTHGLGLYCYDVTQMQIFQTIQGHPSNSVNCLAGDTEKTLWVGTKEGIIGFNKSNSFYLEELEDLKGEEITALLVDSRGLLWIGIGKGCLCYYDGYKIHFISGNTGRDTVFSLKEDNTGKIWFGAKFGGDSGYWENNQISYLGHSGECPTWIGAIEVDNQGKVWLGSISPSTWDGLCCYDGTKYDRVEGIEGSPILCLCEDNKGRIWIGTSEGLICYSDGNLDYITQEDGLSCEIITALFYSADGILWIGTEGGGICCYDGDVCQVIEVSGGAALNVVHSIHQDESGSLWFATEGGLIRFVPKTNPKIAVKSVSADEVYTETEEIQIPNTTNRISFHFTGKSTAEHSSHLVYRFKLNGFDSSWRHTRDLQVEYPQLESGEYYFSIQCVDRSLNYSEVAEVKLNVVTDPQTEHIQALQDALRTSQHPLIAASKAMSDILESASTVANTDMTVLILAETGAGKGLMARRIHDMSPRQHKPFIHLNCGAIPEGLLESELFGHEKGAFTGAVARKIGHFELANGGTLFLDEIGDVPLDSQKKLLNILEEENKLTRVGGVQTIHVDVRVIAATNRNMRKAIQEGAFREDLFFRLSTFVIELPPLRDRQEDISLLIQHFIIKFAHHLNRPVPQIDSDAMRFLQEYSWPGNVRELEHLAQRAVLVCRDDLIRLEDLSIIEVRAEPINDTDVESERESKQLVSVEVQEKERLENALKKSNWIIYGDRGAAQSLGMHPEKLRSRMRKFGIKKPVKRG